MPTEEIDRWKSVNAAFSKQSFHFDEDDLSNFVLQEWRRRIYSHVGRFIKPNSRILELNAGTGIDALHFAKQGHTVHATDVSNGMIAKLKEKAVALPDKITIQQVSFDQLNKVSGKFDYVFSNFGGLNCIDDLQKVTTHLPKLLNDGAFVTWVIMPRISPWEWTWILKGKFGKAFRRFGNEGTVAHLEGEHFTSYYYSVGQISNSFDPQFRLVKSEGLGVFAPPPAALNFVKRFSSLSSILNKVDISLSRFPPFNRWGDHLIVTFAFM